MTESCLVTVEGTPVPLVGVTLRGRLHGGRAAMVLRQRFRNEEQRPIEAIYVFPLPSEAAVTGFSMTCAGRELRGQVRRREDAFRTYDEAIATGHGAALLDRERADVFTVQVGNLLPGEETTIELAWSQPVQALEGELVWSIPTVVAPRYVPGAPQGDRTAHGTEEPTDRVPDADRITPPVGPAPYGLDVDLVVDLGGPAQVTSPSHPIQVTEDESIVHVSLERTVALDRDLVLVVRSRAARGPLTAVACHRPGDGDGAVAITVVPDLADEPGAAPRTVVFLVDVSGSMAGLSIHEAKAALHLCLRHLRTGDRFDIIPFSSSWRRFAPTLATFDERTLQQADRFVEGLHASGGTELLEPLVEAVRAAGDGVVVLLTDGQVGNDREILARALEERRRCRVYSFGIGTAVSEALLSELATATGGAVERIYPGQPIDERVVSVFARATAPRIDALSIRQEGIELHELAPAEPGALVDGEPWTLHGRYAQASSGRLVLIGQRGGREVRIEVPVALEQRADRPDVVVAWATERVRELDRAAVRLSGRRAQANEERIVALALEHGLATRLTSFVVVEERAGERRGSTQPEARVVSVHAPHGWAMFEEASFGGASGAFVTAAGVMPSMAMPAPQGAPASYAPPRPVAASPARAGASGAPSAKAKAGAIFDALARGVDSAMAPLRGRGVFARRRDAGADAWADVPGEPAPMAEALAEAGGPGAPPTGIGRGGAGWSGDAKNILQAQRASGLWDDPSFAGDGDVRALWATAGALLALADQGVSATSPLHGALIAKAVDAVLALATRPAPPDARALEAALLAAWLCCGGRRRRAVEERLTHSGAAPLGDPAEARARLTALSPS